MTLKSLVIAGLVGNGMLLLGGIVAVRALTAPDPSAARSADAPVSVPFAEPPTTGLAVLPGDRHAADAPPTPDAAASAPAPAAPIPDAGPGTVRRSVPPPASAARREALWNARSELISTRRTAP